MPLSKRNGYDGRELPYSLKFAIVESNCTGCPYLQKFGDTENFEEELGCVFPEDIKDLNPNIRESYLTVSEIASNTCAFWKMHTKWNIENVESEAHNILDYMTFPRHIRDDIMIGKIVTGRKISSETRKVGNFDIPTHQELVDDYPVIELSEDCGVRY